MVFIARSRLTARAADAPAYASTYREGPGDEYQNRSGRARRLVASEGLRTAPFEIPLAGGRQAWRQAARGAGAEAQGTGAKQSGPYAARAAPARRALRVVLHPDAAARATLTVHNVRCGFFGMPRGRGVATVSNSSVPPRSRTPRLNLLDLRATVGWVSVGLLCGPSYSFPIALRV